MQANENTSPPDLLKRGYRDEDIVKILGGNWLRVFAEVID